MKPKQERLVNRPAFRQRCRIKEESLTDLATNVRQMVAHAYPGKTSFFLEEEVSNTGSIHYGVRHARDANGC